MTSPISTLTTCTIGQLFKCVPETFIEVAELGLLNRGLSFKKGWKIATSKIFLQGNLNDNYVQENTLIKILNEWRT